MKPFLVRDYGYSGWRIVHEVRPDGKPFCGSRLNMNLWRESDDGGFNEGEPCERCGIASEAYEVRRANGKLKRTDYAPTPARTETA